MSKPLQKLENIIITASNQTTISSLHTGLANHSIDHLFFDTVIDTLGLIVAVRQFNSGIVRVCICDMDAIVDILCSVIVIVDVLLSIEDHGRLERFIGTCSGLKRVIFVVETLDDTDRCQLSVKELSGIMEKYSED